MSYGIGLVGITIGYVLLMLGIVLYYDLALEGEIGATGSMTVAGFGVVALVCGYFGVKGYMYFSY